MDDRVRKSNCDGAYMPCSSIQSLQWYLVEDICAIKAVLDLHLKNTTLFTTADWMDGYQSRNCWWKTISKKQYVNIMTITYLLYAKHRKVADIYNLYSLIIN